MMEIIGGLQEAQFRAAQENKELWLQLKEEKAFDDQLNFRVIIMQDQIDAISNNRRNGIEHAMRAPTRVDESSERLMQLQKEIVELRAMAMQSKEENGALSAAVAKLRIDFVSHEAGLLKWV